MPELQDGYYWVRFKDDKEWTLGKYETKSSEHYRWMVIGSDESFGSEEFEVGERIERVTHEPNISIVW